MGEIRRPEGRRSAGRWARRGQWTRTARRRMFCCVPTIRTTYVPVCGGCRTRRRRPPTPDGVGVGGARRRHVRPTYASIRRLIGNPCRRLLHRARAGPDPLLGCSSTKEAGLCITALGFGGSDIRSSSGIASARVRRRQTGRGVSLGGWWSPERKGDPE
jgi:hypothetical protein